MSELVFQSADSWRDMGWLTVRRRPRCAFPHKSPSAVHLSLCLLFTRAPPPSPIHLPRSTSSTVSVPMCVYSTNNAPCVHPLLCHPFTSSYLQHAVCLLHHTPSTMQTHPAPCPPPTRPNHRLHTMHHSLL